MTLGYPKTIGTPQRRSLTSRAAGRESLLRRLDWVLLLTALTLSVAGAVFVYSATRSVGTGEDPTAFLKRHAINLAIGLGLGLVTMMFDYRTLRAYVPFVYVASILGLVAVLSPLGTSVNGAQAWILLPGGFSIQPSEFMKIALVVGLAMLLAERRDAETEPQFRDVMVALLIALVPLALSHVAARPWHGSSHGHDRAWHSRRGGNAAVVARRTARYRCVGSSGRNQGRRARPVPDRPTPRFREPKS